jgi:muramoyltetrapeptide carboxypeptidase
MSATAPRAIQPPHASPVAPPRLRAGDRIGVVAPSGPVLARALLAGAKVMEEAGFRVVLGKHLRKRRGHLAGPDEDRLDDLNRMLRDPDVRFVFMARGGYGAMRIASGVDWDAMRRDPKIFAGFSDATFLHLGMARHAGVRTLHAPNLHGLGARRGSEISRLLAWLTEPFPPEAVRTLAAPRRLNGANGSAEGCVVGGNLALVHYAAAAGHMPSLDGCILFLEEVNEPPYKIDGMLCALREGGWLAGVRGVALGDFTRCRPRKGYRELRLRQVLEDHLAPLGVPAWSGVRAGHGSRNYALPFGARAVLGKGRLVYTEGLVS